MEDLDLAQGVHWAIERFASGELNEPVHVAMGRLYLAPSSSDPGEFYIVAHCQRLNTEVRRMEEVWLCSCKSYRFSKKGDTCKHVKDIQKRLKWKPKSGRT